MHRLSGFPERDIPRSRPLRPFDRRPAWAAAEAYGCDMSLQESNLCKSPAERIRVHGRALAAVLALREATERRAVGS
jgi:hypothetical protein